MTTWHWWALHAIFQKTAPTRHPEDNHVVWHWQRFYGRYDWRPAAVPPLGLLLRRVETRALPCGLDNCVWGTTFFAIVIVQGGSIGAVLITFWEVHINTDFSNLSSSRTRSPKAVCSNTSSGSGVANGVQRGSQGTKTLHSYKCVNCIICGGACNQPPSPHCIVNNKDKWVGIIYNLSIFVLHVEDVKWCHLVLHCIIGPALSLKDDVPSMEMLSSMTVGVLFKCVIRFVSVAYKIWHEESIHQINFVLPQVIEKNICRVCIYSNRKHWMCRELLLQTQVQECLHKNK